MRAAERACRRRSAVGLGRTQVLVLRLIAAGGAKSPAQLAYDWPSLSEASARASVGRLYARGLVDVAGWHEGRRTYELTARGAEAEQELNTGRRP